MVSATVWVEAGAPREAVRARGQCRSVSVGQGPRKGRGAPDFRARHGHDDPGVPRGPPDERPLRPRRARGGSPPELDPREPRGDGDRIGTGAPSSCAPRSPARDRDGRVPRSLFRRPGQRPRTRAPRGGGESACVQRDPRRPQTSGRSPLGASGPAVRHGMGDARGGRSCVARAHPVRPGRQHVARARLGRQSRLLRRAERGGFARRQRVPGGAHRDRDGVAHPPAGRAGDRTLRGEQRAESDTRLDRAGAECVAAGRGPQLPERSTTSVGNWSWGWTS